MTPRESYRVFPAWTSRFWTWLTGAALDGERPWLGPNPWRFLLTALASWVAGLGLGLWGASLVDGWHVAALLAGWCLAVSGARQLVSTVVHQCIHGRFSGRRSLDMFLGELITVLTLTQAAQHYRSDHFGRHHDNSLFATPEDPPAQFLMRIGFRPGRSVRRLWLQLLLNTVSPDFHGYFLWQRLKSNFVQAGLARRSAAFAYVLLWLAAGAAGLGAQAILLGAVVPMVLLYQLSVMFEFISEHAWLAPAPALERARHVHRTHSWGRFCGAPTPQGGSLPSRWLRWTGWWAAHLLYHLPVRLLVLPGDLPQHDFHHRVPNTREWPIAAYARQQHLRRTKETALEFWGLHRAIHHVFVGIAAGAEPRAFPHARERHAPQRTEA